MRKIVSLLILIVISSGTFVAKGEWEKLFNGKDLTGWEPLNGTAEYTIENGEIVGTSKTGSPNTFLATTRIFDDFILEYEMKMDTGIAEVSCLTNKLTDYEKTNGWKLLWNGKTAEGWRGAGLSTFPDKGWTIEDGMLITNKGENKGGGDIVTVKKYKNFVLEVDFKITEGANSGIKYFIQSEPGKENTVGFEFQILDDDRHPDAKLGIDGNRTLASLYDLVKANSQVFDKSQPVKRVNGVGQWNRARIEVNGKKVTHYLNGVKVLEIIRGSQAFKEHIAQSKFSKAPGFGDFDDGYILLQNHGDEVAFRNIKIKEL